MLGGRYKIGKAKYDMLIKPVGFRFTKYKFENTSMTYIYEWTLRLGIIVISKWQTKSYAELKKIADAVWEIVWDGTGLKTDPKKGGEPIEDAKN